MMSIRLKLDDEDERELSRQAKELELKPAALARSLMLRKLRESRNGTNGAGKEN